MPANKFNEAEKYLIANWQKARLVEDSMEDIRHKYAEICDQVLDAIKDEHKKIEWSKACVTQFWCDGFIGIGRKSWPNDETGGIICMDNLRLELLLDTNEECPFIGIYAGTPKKPMIDVKGIKRIISAADKLLTKDELDRCVKDEPTDYYYVLYYYLPEGKTELLNMIIKGDGQQFVDCLVEHFNVFIKFIPVLDELFSKSSKQ